MNKKAFQTFSLIALAAVIVVGIVLCLPIPQGVAAEKGGYDRYRLDKDTAFDVFLKKHAWIDWWNNAPAIGQYKKDPPYKIGFITSWRGNPWQEVNIAEFKREVERSPLITDYVHMDSAGSVDTEMSNLRAMLTMYKAGKLDGILVDPLDAMAFVDTIEEIYDAGCPIILFNNAANTTKYNCYVGNDPWTFGTLSAEWLAKRLGYKGKILFFRG